MTTRASRYQKGKTNLDFTEARDSEWQWHQLGSMQVCTSLQTDNHASTPALSIFTGQMPFLPPNQQRQSTEGNINTNESHHIFCHFLAKISLNDISANKQPKVSLITYHTYLPTRANKRWPTVITSDVTLVSDRAFNSSVMGPAGDSPVSGRDVNSLLSGRAMNLSISSPHANWSRSRIARTPPRTQICDWVGSWSRDWNSSRVRKSEGLSNSQPAPKLAADFGPIPIFRQCSSYNINQYSI